MAVGVRAVGGIVRTGKMAVDAVTSLDYYLIQGFILWIAVMFLAINFIIDLLSAFLDPRIRKN